MTRPFDGAAQSRKPVILTVDDDPAVSRAVARDLRRKYGEDHRIVRAESGAEALDSLKQLKLRGETVAALVADYRMPQMTGIEFLEHAMDLYPSARRILLTAYADTHAAIDAINVVDLDHYLLKPWDPPEEKLYPVIDALLEAWRAAPDHPIPHTKVIGHRWSARSWEVRDFLARNGLHYSWFMADEPEGERLLNAAGADSLRLPVVVTEHGDPLVEPSDAELADKLGLTTTPSQEFYDLIVIGGGPAGLAAAVYGASEGLRTVLIERTATGGQAGQSSRIENYLGFPDGVSGGQLAERARRQAEKFGAELITARKAIALEVNGPKRTVRFADGGFVDAHAVILATGVAYRNLDAEGCNELTGCGVYYGAAISIASDCEEEEVYVIGGANSAGQAAMYLSRTAKSVNIVVRAPSLQASMSYYLIQQIEANPKINVLTCTEVQRATGDGHLEKLTLVNNRTEEIEEVSCARMFIFIGAAPRTDWLDGVLARDDHGFILTGPDLRNVCGWTLDRPPHHLETSVPGVFATGDVRSTSAKRVAAAVGEGSMAVMLVHRYLAES
ncbi:NAD(P)/FAD-dependent oxidoreductase [Mycobacterium montefiorense]|uniref:Fused response regulator/thioredoxin-disulfide reductase n=1 Tax=Mycobacterium montefiorense TaxID=154654 RepID=A0AA37PMA8_9MYCO|nr:FAD-dependent oxidoreductase [Mycobacterium montefiorense]GBG36901.1 fused response regulator/thioredoxin-disulfide reductase [Mycobacterium montefiorense]GKU37807.1 fused response regulator/thioredoxin-disulfide reductase [Mycobacterium montefiorense]GKU42766.1 fused response regulator/thioredoxin-disulfide reductase [Mycobacterium montefiorense]GKU46357.1 fused response regulator/thioredoxin-disulfide reductase [Mycobacterium montefiorense]GKU51059.1 fused response regulator/thioredoxin-d